MSVFLGWEGIDRAANFSTVMVSDGLCHHLFKVALGSVEMHSA